MNYTKRSHPFASPFLKYEKGCTEMQPFTIYETGYYLIHLLLKSDYSRVQSSQPTAPSVKGPFIITASPFFKSLLPSNLRI